MAVLPTFVISKRQKEDMWALDIHRQGTDLGNLIGIFDFGYFTSKNAVLTILKDFWRNFILEMSNIPTNTSFRASQMVKMAVLGAS